jgi:hypothetical protein
VRILTALFVAACLGASHPAVAQPPLGASTFGCKDFLSTVDHHRPSLADWVTQPRQHPTVWSDSRLIVNAAAPVGLIVDQCRKPG